MCAHADDRTSVSRSRLADSRTGYSTAMDLMSWLRLIIVLGGAGVAIYGVWILITGRAPRSDQCAFRRPTDAGVCYVCFGLALALLVLSQLWNEHHQTLSAAAALIVAVMLIGLVIRYRPRQDKRR
jgi:hypothetical protein